MKWSRITSPVAVLHLVALTVMAVLLWYCFVEPYRYQPNSYSLTLVTSGKWAIRYLLVCLAMTPLHIVFNWRTAIKMRKPAGLWAFAFGAFHFSIYLSKMKLFWFQQTIPSVAHAFGFTSICILLLLALTSMHDSMKHLGKWWKPLHRLVYLAGVAAVVHTILESPNTRVTAYDPDVQIEAVVYMAILIALLLTRMPQVRSWLIRKSLKGAGK